MKTSATSRTIGFFLLLLLTVGHASFVVPRPAGNHHPFAQQPRRLNFLAQTPLHDPQEATPTTSLLKTIQHACTSTLLALVLTTATTTTTIASVVSLPQPAMATDSDAIVGCLFQKCQLPLAKCIVNPNCLANVICINTCNGRKDETGCQIECGNLFENDVVGEFNKCAVSDMRCVPKKQDDGSYPIPTASATVPKFDTSFFNGKWYITAGQNKLFDIFPCQVHFFTEPEPGIFYGKLNWRVEEPDGEFFTQDSLQRFVRDPKDPAHLINHDSEYLHYQDGWYIIDYARDDITHEQ